MKNTGSSKKQFCRLNFICLGHFASSLMLIILIRFFLSLSKNLNQFEMETYDFKNHEQLLFTASQYLMQYLKSIYDWMDKSVTSHTPIALHCWAMLMDSYHNSYLTLHTPAEILCISIIYLTLRLHSVNVPCNEVALRPWWKVA